MDNVNVAGVQGMLDSHAKLNALIEQTRLRNIYKIKPMIDGKGIQLLYGCKPGRHMKPIMDECVKFQILNLDATYQEVEDYMMKQQEEFHEKYGAPPKAL